MWRSRLCVVALAMLSAFTTIADRWPWLLLTECMEQGANGDYKGQTINGWRKGYGMVLQENGSFYVGLFQENATTGTGIIVAPNASFLQYFDSTAYYVGKVKDGKPHGLGKCYDDYGKLLYRGDFKDGKPISNLITDQIGDNHRFVNIDLGDGQYIFTEVNDTTLDGQAFICGVDKSLWIGRFRNHTVAGLSVNIARDGEWRSFFVRNGEAIPQSSSQNYKDLKEAEQRLQMQMVDSMRAQSERAVAAYEERGGGFSSRLQKFMSGFATACEIIGSAANCAASVVNLYQAVSDPSSMSNYGMSGSQSGSSLPMQYSNWAKTAEKHYNSLTNTGVRAKSKGEDAGGSNVQSLSPGNYVSQKKSLREAQREMKSIRLKAKRKGIDIQKSRYEDISVSY